MNSVQTVATVGGEQYEAIRATIIDTHLGFEDHGIFAVGLNFEWGSSGQGTGLYAAARKIDGRHHISEAGGDLIIRFIEIAGVSTWDQLKGRDVYLLKRQRERSEILGLLSVQNPEISIIFDEHTSQYDAELGRRKGV